MEEMTSTPLGDRNVETQIPPQQIPNETPSKKRPSKILIIIFVVLLIITALLYALFSMDILKQFNLFNSDSRDNQNTQEEEEQEEENLFSAYEGDTISAQLPEGWSIEEYYDGEGTDMLVEGQTYTGLTALRIFKGETEIFFVRAIYGIGFAGCPTYAKFEDENPSYWEEIEDINDEMGETTTVTDYTTTSYIEFEWLGTTFRRIAKYYNYDTVSGNEYFEPSCVPSLLSLEGIEFLPEEGPAAKSYDYGATEESTLEDLLIVDSILESMVLSN